MPSLLSKRSERHWPAARAAGMPGVSGGAGSTSPPAKRKSHTGLPFASVRASAPRRKSPFSVGETSSPRCSSESTGSKPSS